MKIINCGVALALGLGASLAVNAAGLGKLTVHSALGQELNAEIDLVSLQPGEAEVLNARVAPPESYRDAHIEYSPLLRLLRFTVDKRPNGQSYLKITSIGPINEPFLDALVEVSWPAGKLQREYPILLDPPGYAQAKVAPPTVAATAPAPAPKPATAPSETPPAATPAAAPSAPAAAAPAAESSATSGVGQPSAQAEMQASGTATPTPATDTYGPVEKGDYLSKIANQVKPADVSLEQMLVALYRENKEAFSGNNMNRLKTGQILRIPSSEEIEKIPLKEARREIHTQVQDWNAYREQLAGAIPSMPARGAAPNVASGSVGSAAVTPPAPVAAATPSDRLRISRSQGAAGKAGKAGSTQDRLNAMQEELTAKDNALKEAQSRVADLEKQIQEMQRLLDLKGGAAKGAAPKVAVVPPPPAAEAPKAEPPKAEAPKAEPTQVAAATPAPKPEEAPKAEAPKAEAPAQGAEAPKAEPPKAAAKPAAKKPAPKKVAPPPPSLMDEVMDNPMYLAGGVGALALLGIGAFMFVRRRRGSAESAPDSQMTSAFPSDLKPGATTAKPAAGLVDTGNSSFLTDFDKTGPGAIDTDEVDPVAEAEVYIAYGRDAQAEEILKEAMARDKNRHEIALKLLEIYHARKSATAFETVAKELRGAVGEGSPLWQKAAAMGAQIDPGNSLYGAAAAGTATYTAMAPSAPAPKPNVDFDLESSASASSAPAPSFDLDLDARKPSAPAPDLPVESSSSIDFDLPGAGAAPRVDVPVDQPKEEKPAFDFDLSGLELGGGKPGASAPAAAAPSGGGGLDLADLSLDSPSAESGGEAVGTKLELAKAYLEIGDKDGAREILTEVAKEGSSAQKEEAKKLIASL
jgi:pilus assembly protein FimV